jgi:cytochrome oxidase Cu insertion factor (SCO1/SenC/PrrC family)
MKPEAVPRRQVARNAEWPKSPDALSPHGMGAVAVFGLLLAGALISGMFHRSSGAVGPGGLPGPLGGPDVAQDVNTLVGKPATTFTLADSEGKRYAVTPGRGRPTVLVFHMGIT